MWLKFIVPLLKPVGKALRPLLKYLLMFLAGAVAVWMLHRYSVLTVFEESLGLRDEQAKVLYEVNEDDRIQKQKNQKRRAVAEKTARQQSDIDDRAPAAIRNYLNELLP